MFYVLDYPTLHASPYVTMKVINNYSLLYHVRGGSDSLPYLLISHLDVVPVNNNTWYYPPFDGIITDSGYIIGRGAMDDKHSVFVSTPISLNCICFQKGF